MNRFKACTVKYLRTNKSDVTVATPNVLIVLQEPRLFEWSKENTVSHSRHHKPVSGVRNILPFQIISARINLQDYLGEKGLIFSLLTLIKCIFMFIIYLFQQIMPAFPSCTVYTTEPM